MQKFAQWAPALLGAGGATIGSLLAGQSASGTEKEEETPKERAERVRNAYVVGALLGGGAGAGASFLPGVNTVTSSGKRIERGGLSKFFTHATPDMSHGEATASGVAGAVGAIALPLFLGKLTHGAWGVGRNPFSLGVARKALAGTAARLPDLNKAVEAGKSVEGHTASLRAAFEKAIVAAKAPDQVAMRASMEKEMKGLTDKVMATRGPTDMATRIKYRQSLLGQSHIPKIDNVLNDYAATLSKAPMGGSNWFQQWFNNGVGDKAFRPGVVTKHTPEYVLRSFITNLLAAAGGQQAGSYGATGLQQMWKGNE